MRTSKTIIVGCGQEAWNPRKQEFIQFEPVELVLEHSLASIDLWESKWHKPYLSEKEKTPEEVLDYIRCMTVNEIYDPDVYERLTNDNIKEINEYIEAPMTATTVNIRDNSAKGKKEITTSELIYYQMISCNIPIEFEHWHLNKLLTLLQVFAIKNDPKPKKMSRADTARMRNDINRKRRAALHTRG